MEFILISLLVTLGVGNYIYETLTDNGDSSSIDDEDTVIGDDGDNTLNGDTGGDLISGGAGNDVIFGRQGGDLISGGSGDDRIFLGDGDDFSNAVGDEGNDFIRGGSGNDFINDSLGSNTLHGDVGQDTLSSVDAPSDAGTEDTLYGGFGNDILIGDDGDFLYGGDGYDVFSISYLLSHTELAVVKDFDEDEDNQIVISAPEFNATDTLSFSETTFNGASGLMVTLAGSQVVFIEDATLSTQNLVSLDTNSNPNAGPVNQITGSNTQTGGDILLGTPGKDAIRGLDGNDGLFGGSGDDVIYGGNGDDIAHGGHGDDRIFLNDGNDETEGATGQGNDLIRGGAGSDVLQDWIGSNTLFGDIGSDTLDGLDNLDRNTSDTLYGGFGDDFLFGDEGDILYGGQGSDSYELLFDADRATSDLTVINDYDINNDNPTIVLNTVGYGANPTFNAVLGHSYNNQTGLLIQIGPQNQSVLFLPGVTTVPSISVIEYQGLRV
jgi:Ca2+-binding RTX toxin-like protein